MRTMAICGLLALVLGLAAPRVHGQEAAAPRQPAPSAQPGTPSPTPAPAPGAQKPAPAEGAPREREPEGKPVNLQIELTITDRTGADAPSQKVVSMVVADATVGRVRASTQTLVAGRFVPVALNVDARPQLLSDTSLKLQVTLEYTPIEGFKADEKAAQPTHLNQTLNVILQSGKPMVVSQAADPSSDRRITVEVKATVMK